MFVDHGCFEKDESAGLALARECKHEDAQFLASLFPDGVPMTEDEAASRETT